MQPRHLFPALLGIIAACQAPPDAGEEALNVSAIATEKVALPKVSQPLTRRDILMAATEAASDFAAGIEGVEQQRSLKGQPFSFRIRYCGSQVADPAFRIAFDAKRGVFRAAARPDIDLSAPLVRSLVPQPVEAVEGFWIARPWVLDAACPTADQPETGDETEVASDTPDVPVVRQPTVGIAEFFDGQSARTLRREGRAYEATHKVDADLKGVGVDLVLEGRLKEVKGRTVLCTGGKVDTPPTCIVSVEFDRIRLELDDGRLLGEWSGA